MKTYLGISRDHSASMRGIARAAARDYNNTMQLVRDESDATNQKTIVSVIKCGVGPTAQNIFESVNCDIKSIKLLDEGKYNANGHATPLWDSVAELIKVFKNVPDANDTKVAFLIEVITDGDDNHSKLSGAALGREIQKLQATDRWTFVFRVPRNGRSKSTIMGIGVPEGNILEWDTTSEQGMEISTQATQQGMKEFYATRSLGGTSTKSFYTADMSKVKASIVKTTLDDISASVSQWKVLPSEDGIQIRDFCEKRLGNSMLKGAAFYELNKPERKVQDTKLILIRDKKSGSIYAGAAARHIIGLPHVGDVKLVPGNHGSFDIYIQSTSVNRKVVADSSVIYWPGALNQ